VGRVSLRFTIVSAPRGGDTLRGRQAWIDRGWRGAPAIPHGSNGLVARSSGVSRGHVTLAVGLKRPWLTAHRKDLKGEFPVLCRKHRDLQLLKAFAQSLLRGKPHPPRYCTATAGNCNAKITEERRIERRPTELQAARCDGADSPSKVPTTGRGRPAPTPERRAVYIAPGG
jgi:hypothetical protein